MLSETNSLNFIRLIFAGMVIVSHSFVLGGYGKEFVVLGNTLGGWGVIGFFCTSGYLIANSRLRNQPGQYLIQRIGRIFPAYIVCLLAVVLLFAPLAQVLTLGSLDGYLSTAPTPLDFLINNLNPALLVNQFEIGITLSEVPYPNTWIGPLYTLFYEFIAYIIIGAFFCVRQFRKPVPVICLWGIFVSFQFLAPFLGEHYIENASFTFTRITRLIPCFLGGSVVCMIRDKLPQRWYIALLSALLVFVVITFTPINGWYGVAILSPFITYIILYIASTFTLGKLGGLTRKHDLSYGVYIYGFAVQQLLSVLFTYKYIPKPNIYIYILLSFVFVIFFAAASWFVVERPIMQAIRKSKNG